MWSLCDYCFREDHGVQLYVWDYAVVSILPFHFYRIDQVALAILTPA